MGNTRTVFSHRPGKTEALPELPYIEGQGEVMRRKLAPTRLALSIRLAMVTQRAGRK